MGKRLCSGALVSVAALVLAGAVSARPSDDRQSVRAAFFTNWSR